MPEDLKDDGSIKAIEARVAAEPGTRTPNLTPDSALYKDGDEKDQSSASSSRAQTPVPAANEARPMVASPADHKERTKLQIAFIMSALCMAVFLAAVDITIITTALPTIAEHFDSSTGYTWIGSAYMLAASAAMPSFGKISDIFGRKPILLFANFVFFIGSLVAAISTNIGMLIAGRVIQGIGGGGLITLVNICISDLFSMRSRSAYFGIIGMVWAVASALGPVVGGAFSEKVTWRWCFYINLPLDGAAFLIIMFFLDLHTPKTPLLEGLRAIDWLGSLAIVGGTVMFLMGLQFGGISYPWDSATVVCLILFGFLTIGVFFLIEWRVAVYPIMPIRLFRSRSNLAAMAVCFFHGFVFIGGSYFLPVYFQAVLGADPLMSGVYLLPLALSLSITSALAGVFIRKTGLYLPPIHYGLALMCVGFGLLIDLAVGSSWAKIIIYQIIAGVGTGPNFQSPLLALQAGCHPKDIATATASFGFVRNLSTAISIVIGGVVFQNEIQKRAGIARDRHENLVGTALSGSNAAASIGFINSLPAPERSEARAFFAESLRPMWIMYTAFAVAGLLVSFLIRKQSLTKQHVETRTGLEAEKARKAEMEEERKRKAEEMKETKV